MTATHPFLVGLVGSGVTASLTPAMHMRAARRYGLDYVYRPLDLTVLDLSPERLPDILAWARRLGFDALNITHPCKRLVLSHLDEIDPVAEALGAVNTVLFTDRGLAGYNTDTTGFAQALRTGLPDAALGEVIQLGAGGAGSAVADALLRSGVQTLTIVDLDVDRATELAGELTARHAARVEVRGIDDVASLLASADGIVHCTPTGMHDHPGIPFSADLLDPRLWVADIVYRPLETELLAAARAAGCRTLDGGRMAVYQAVDAFELITGIRPDAEDMARDLDELVAAADVLT